MNLLFSLLSYCTKNFTYIFLPDFCLHLVLYRTHSHFWNMGGWEKPGLQQTPEETSWAAGWSRAPRRCWVYLASCCYWCEKPGSTPENNFAQDPRFPSAAEFCKKFIHSTRKIPRLIQMSYMHWKWWLKILAKSKIRLHQKLLLWKSLIFIVKSLAKIKSQG